MKRYELYEKYIGTGESIADTRLAQDGEWVAYADYQQALAEKDRELKDYISAAEADRRIGEQQCDELTDKLAEKEREIQQIREHEFQRGYHEREAAYQQLMAQRDKLAEDLATTKAWKDDWKLEVIAHHKTQEEYNTLMAQAVRFAEELITIAALDGECRMEAEAFLRERALEADPFGDLMKQFYKERKHDSKG